MRTFRNILTLVTSVVIASTAHAADCQKAFFGWDTTDGYHISGVLANEGVTGTNRRGYQNDKTDKGNYRNGKNCGGTAFGITCRDHPGFNPRTATIDDAIGIYSAPGGEWYHINGKRWISQYAAYKTADLATNIGKEELAIICRIFRNYHNGTAHDEDINGLPLTDAEVDWFNAYTAPRIVPADYVPRYEGDFKPGDEDNTQRELFFLSLVELAQKRYGHVVRNNKPLGVYLFGWSWRNTKDFYRNVHRSLN